MCMYWGESGWWHQSGEVDDSSGDLDWAAVQHLVQGMARESPSYILSGGEPLLYNAFGQLAESLRSARCFSIVCTNGTLLDRHTEVFKDNPYMTLLVSLDGLKEENDLLRGAGVFEKVRENVHRLKAMKNPPYIGLQFTIRPENVHCIHDFCQEMVRWKIDWLLLNPCWFVTAQQAEAYCCMLKDEYGVEPQSQKGYMLPYPLDRQMFISQWQAIGERQWPFQISCYLKNPAEIHRYLDHPETPPGNTFCYKQWFRMDVTPEGDITPCAQFPDIVFGNISRDDPLEIWNSEPYQTFRKDIRQRLLPVCSKCDVLYLYDAGRKYL